MSRSIGSRIAIAILILLVLVPACVPAAVNGDPRGAIMLTVVPSAATRGEPFATADGWTVTIELLAVNTYAGGTASPDYVTCLFDGSRPNDILIRAVPAVAAHAELRLISARFVYDHDTLADVRVSRDVRARFDRPADGQEHGECVEPRNGFPRYCEVNGPSWYLVAKAQKADRVVRIDLGLVDESLAEPAQASAIVRANAVTKTEIALRGEALFTNGSGAVVFDDLAAADADGDGILRYDELLATPDPEYIAPPPDPDGFEPLEPYPGAPPEDSMIATLHRRAEVIFPRRE